jgi:stearoyl-CoA desaturase (delta-9 desaturase)
VHHQYVDIDAMDPHKHSDVTFWRYVMVMAPRSNAKIRERYRDHWGTGQRTRFLQSQGFINSVSMALVAGNLLLWYMLFGPAGFIFFYIPSFIATYMLVADINYSTHPKNPATSETRPVNLDHNLYHKICNAILSGVYYHANHHRRPFLFNPKKMSLRLVPGKSSGASAKEPAGFEDGA